MSLDPSRFTENVYVNTDWTLTVERGTSLEDVLNPAFLANVANRLHPYDHIRVRVDSGEWYAELMVLQCGRVWAKLMVLSKHSLTDEEVNAEEVDDQYFVQFCGPHKKFCVIRKSDKEAIKEQCANKSEAQAWLSSHLLTL
jgi:hypothetical protein